MGLFSKSKLSEEQVEKLNNLLPIEHQRKIFYRDDINDFQEGIFHRFQSYIKQNIEIKVDELKKQLTKLEDSKTETLAAKIQVYNTEPYNCKPLGMVDIGATHKFAAASTGDRFAGGLIGYAIENAADNVYAKGSMQEEAVNSTKLDLLKKAKSIYPQCSNFFKYEVDFRELGSSGNVFIYMRGTACEGENILLKNAEAEYLASEEQITLDKLNAEFDNEKRRLQFAKEQLAKVPRNSKQLDEF